jgi:hypothetical protein
MFRHVRIATLALLLLVPPTLAVSASGAGATSARPHCGITWGSGRKAVGSGPVFPPSPIGTIRTGRHACYDRLVIDLQGRPVGYRVGYVSRVLDQAHGVPLSLRGGAFIDVTLYAPTYNLSGRPTVDLGQLPGVRGYRTFRDLASGGSSEGYTTLGLGVRARLPFRVFTLSGPGSGSRMVVDVAHRW